MTYLVFDLETTTKTVYGRTANPWYNKIIAIGTKSPVYRNFSMVDSSGLDSGTIFHTTSLVPIEVLVGHNIKFDLLYLWKNKDLQDFFLSGGQIWCTQLAEYYLTNQQEKFASLRKTAQKYGCLERPKHMEAYWEKGIDTSEIPIQIVCQDCTADVLDTEQIYLKQVEKAKKLGMYNLIKLQMDALLATCEMEYNGMQVDLQILNFNQLRLEQKIKEVEENLYYLIKPYWPLKETINLNSSTQLSWLLFGGVTTETHIIPQELNGRPVVFVSGLSKGQLKLKKIQKDVIIKGLQVKPLESWAGKKDGIYSTKEEVLEIILTWFRTDQEALDLGIGHQNGYAAATICKKLLELRGLTRELNTNYVGLKEYLYQEANLVHAQYSHCGYGNRNEESLGGTETARLSCSKPNMQNLPKADDSLVRQHFISRYKNGKLMEGDLAQIELVVQAQISQDKKYMEDVLNGIDFHIKRLAVKENLPYETVFNFCKVARDPGWLYKRSIIKQFSFQRAYGAGANRIAQNTGLTVEEVKQLIHNEDLEYNTLKQFNMMLIDQVKRTQTKTDKITKKGYPVMTGWYKNPVGARYSFYTEDAPDWLKEKTTFSPTKIKNYIVQGTAANIMLILLGKIWRQAIKYRNKFILINTVHDSILIDVQENQEEFACNLIKKEVQLLKDVIKEQFNYRWELPIIMEFKSGPSWYFV